MSDYTQELGDEICAQLIDGKSLRDICQREGMPSARTVHRWVASDETFCQQYARAREAQADTLAEEILQIADDGRNDTYLREDGSEGVNQDHINRSRLRVDARKWFASKVAPKKYGDRITQEHTGANGSDMFAGLGQLLGAKLDRIARAGSASSDKDGTE